MRKGIPFCRVAAVWVGLIASAAQACPVCDTSTGEQVRAGIFDGRFAYNVLITLLPFAVFAGIGAVIHFGLPFAAGRKTRAPVKSEDGPAGHVSGPSKSKLKG